MRSITSGVIAELRKAVVRPFILVEIDFSDAPLYVWSGIGSLQYPATTGPTYVGVGTLGAISTITETTDPQANGVTLSLSGIPTSLLDEALSYCRQGQVVKIWQGFADTAGAVIPDPIGPYQFRLDTVTVADSDETCTITISAESRLADLQRGRVRRFTDDDQQRTCPGDDGFQFQPLVQDWNQSWGAPIQNPLSVIGL